MAGTRVGGKKAYKVGKGFETHFELVCKMRGALCLKHGTPGRWAGKRLIPIRKAESNAYDFTLSFQGVSAFIDTKTFDTDKITRTHVDEDQVRVLESLERHGQVAGYVIYFRKANAVCFCKASELMKFFTGETRVIHGREMILLGRLEDFYIGRLFSLNWEKDLNG